MRGDTKVLERLEKQGRRRERAERKIKKAIDKRDLRRGKKRKAKKRPAQAACIDPKRNATLSPAQCAATPRRKLRAVDLRTAAFSAAAVGGSVEWTATPFLWAKRLHATLEEALVRLTTGQWLPTCFLSSKLPQQHRHEGGSSKTRGHRCRRRQNVPI